MAKNRVFGVVGVLLGLVIGVPCTGHAAATVVEGVIAARSALPPAASSDYPECRYTARFVCRGVVAGAAVPREIQLTIDGFRDRRPLAGADLAAGDLITARISPFDELPGGEQGVQLADDLALVSLQNYYVHEFSKIEAYSGNYAATPVGVAEATPKFEGGANPPLSAEAIAAQQLAIAAELARMEKLIGGVENRIDELDREFNAAWKAELARDPEGFNRTDDGRIAWRNVENSFWSLPVKYRLISHYQPVDQQKIEALQSFRDFLQDNGVQLIITITPDFYAIAARVINPAFRLIPDYLCANLVKQFCENSLEALYVSDRLIADFNRYQWAFFFPGNNHPSDTTQDIMTDVLAERLARYDFPPTLEREKFSVRAVPHAYGDACVFPPNCDVGENHSGAPFQCREVLYNGEAIPPDAASPVLVLGNSFIQKPLDYPCSYPTLLASKLRIPVDCLMINGWRFAGIAPRMVVGNPERFLVGKRVVVMNFVIGHLYRPEPYPDVRALHKRPSPDSCELLKTYAPPPSTAATPADAAFTRLGDRSELTAKKGEPRLIAEVPLEGVCSGERTLVVVSAVAARGGTPLVWVNSLQRLVLEDTEMTGGEWDELCFELPSGAERVEVWAEGLGWDCAIAIRNVKIYRLPAAE